MGYHSSETRQVATKLPISSVTPLTQPLFPDYSCFLVLVPTHTIPHELEGNSVQPEIVTKTGTSWAQNTSFLYDLPRLQEPAQTVAVTFVCIQPLRTEQGYTVSLSYNYREENKSPEL